MRRNRYGFGWPGSSGSPPLLQPSTKRRIDSSIDPGSTHRLYRFVGETGLMRFLANPRCCHLFFNSKKDVSLNLIKRMVWADAKRSLPPSSASRHLRRSLAQCCGSWKRAPGASSEIATLLFVGGKGEGEGEGEGGGEGKGARAFSVLFFLCCVCHYY